MTPILVIEDERDIAELIALHLHREGYQPLLAHDGITGLEMARSEALALILLDLMLPGMDGVRVFKELRRYPATRETPVIMLTARAQTEDRVAGLELGADDYVTKPFSPRELMLRIKVALKRTQAAAGATASLTTGPFRFDSAALICYLGSQPLDLTLTEFKLLYYLCERAGAACDRNDLLTAVWGYSDAAHSRTLDTHIKRLRSKLGTHADRIETAHGIGYLLRCEPSP